MNSPEKQPSLKITAMSMADVAKVLSAALNRRITEDQVREVAQAGDLIQAGDTVNLIHYTAWLSKEVTHAPTPTPAPGTAGTPEND